MQSICRAAVFFVLASVDVGSAQANKGRFPYYNREDTDVPLDTCRSCVAAGYAWQIGECQMHSGLPLCMGRMAPCSDVCPDATVKCYSQTQKLAVEMACGCRGGDKKPPGNSWALPDSGARPPIPTTQPATKPYVPGDPGEGGAAPSNEAYCAVMDVSCYYTEALCEEYDRDQLAEAACRAETAQRSCSACLSSDAKCVWKPGEAGPGTCFFGGGVMYMSANMVRTKGECSKPGEVSPPSSASPSLPSVPSIPLCTTDLCESDSWLTAVAEAGALVCHDNGECVAADHDDYGQCSNGHEGRCIMPTSILDPPPASPPSPPKCGECAVKPDAWAGSVKDKCYKRPKRSCHKASWCTWQEVACSTPPPPMPSPTYDDCKTIRCPRLPPYSKGSPCDRCFGGEQPTPSPIPEEDDYCLGMDDGEDCSVCEDGDVPPPDNGLANLTCSTGCATLNDGCNDCRCTESGEVGPCTKKSCPTKSDDPIMSLAEYLVGSPIKHSVKNDDSSVHKCIAAKPKESLTCATGCSLWYDGCNECKCAMGEPAKCTERLCITRDMPKCQEAKTSAFDGTRPRPKPTDPDKDTDGKGPSGSGSGAGMGKPDIGTKPARPDEGKGENLPSGGTKPDGPGSTPYDSKDTPYGSKGTQSWGAKAEPKHGGSVYTIGRRLLDLSSGRPICKRGRCQAGVCKAAPRPCCKGLTVECLACDAGVSRAEYCKMHPATEGCKPSCGTCGAPSGKWNARLGKYCSQLAFRACNGRCSWKVGKCPAEIAPLPSPEAEPEPSPSPIPCLEKPRCVLVHSSDILEVLKRKDSSWTDRACERLTLRETCAHAEGCKWEEPCAPQPPSPQPFDPSVCSRIRCSQPPYAKSSMCDRCFPCAKKACGEVCGSSHVPFYASASATKAPFKDDLAENMKKDTNTDTDTDKIGGKDDKMVSSMGGVMDGSALSYCQPDKRCAAKKPVCPTASSPPPPAPSPPPPFDSGGPTPPPPSPSPPGTGGKCGKCGKGALAFYGRGNKCKYIEGESSCNSSTFCSWKAVECSTPPPSPSPPPPSSSGIPTPPPPSPSPPPPTSSPRETAAECGKCRPAKGRQSLMYMGSNSLDNYCSTLDRHSCDSCDPLEGYSCDGKCKWSAEKCPPALCCQAMTASCEACKVRMSVEEYCAIQSKKAKAIAGCEELPPPDEDKDVCCEAMTASCEACKMGLSIAAYCDEHSSAAGCEGDNPSTLSAGESCPVQEPGPNSPCSTLGAVCKYGRFCCHGKCNDITTAECVTIDGSDTWMVAIVDFWCPDSPSLPPPQPPPPLTKWALCTETELGGDLNGINGFTLGDAVHVAQIWSMDVTPSELCIGYDFNQINGFTLGDAIYVAQVWSDREEWPWNKKP